MIYDLLRLLRHEHYFPSLRSKELMAIETFPSVGDTVRLEDWDVAQRISSTREVRASEDLSHTIENFAVLSPVGQTAPIRFDELARCKLADQDWQPHARKFIHIIEKRQSGRNCSSLT